MTLSLRDCDLIPELYFSYRTSSENKNQLSWLAVMLGRSNIFVKLFPCWCALVFLQGLGCTLAVSNCTKHFYQFYTLLHIPQESVQYSRNYLIAEL